MWAVLAGGFTSPVMIVALLLAGAAGIGPIPLLACAAGLLAAGVAGLFAAARRARALGAGWAAGVLMCTGTGLLADAGVLAACFGLAGLPVPWRGLLFAYAAGQLAGRVVPLAGGIGGVEGGMLGTLTLTGTPLAAADAAVIVYRVAGPSAPPGPQWQPPSPAAPRGVPGRDASRQPAGGPPP